MSGYLAYLIFSICGGLQQPQQGNCKVWMHECINKSIWQMPEAMHNDYPFRDIQDEAATICKGKARVVRF